MYWLCPQPQGRKLPVGLSSPLYLETEREAFFCLQIGPGHIRKQKWDKDEGM
jgi:hypothetical protein